MRKKLSVAVLALLLLSGSAFCEDTVVPGKRQNNMNWTNLFRAAWSYVVHLSI